MPWSPQIFSAFSGTCPNWYHQKQLAQRDIQDAGIPTKQLWYATRFDGQNIFRALLKAGCSIGFGQRGLIEAVAKVALFDRGVDIPTLHIWQPPKATWRTTLVSIVRDAPKGGFRPSFLDPSATTL